MKRLPFLIAIVVIAILLLGTLVLAQPTGRGPSATYVVEPGTASGEGYHLAGRSWQVQGTASGVGYRLQGPVLPLQGAGCCCAWLPCVFRDSP